MAMRMGVFLLLCGVLLLNAPSCAGIDLGASMTSSSNLTVCNMTVQLDEAHALHVISSHPMSLPAPEDCWLEVRAPQHHLVSLQNEDDGLETEDTACSNWASFLDGGQGTPIRDKVCGSTSVHWESTGNSALIWYHTETLTSKPSFRLKVHALRCPTMCEEKVSLVVRGHVHAEPFRRTGASCSSHACYWKLCAASAHGRVELHPKPYGRGDTIKCDYSQVLMYDVENLEGNPPQIELTCHHVYLSSGQCMFLAYKRHSSSTSRFHAFVGSTSSEGIPESSHVYDYFALIFPTFTLCLCLVAFGALWCFRSQQIRNIGYEVRRHLKRTSRRERERGQRGQATSARGNDEGASGEASTPQVAFIAGVAFLNGSDQPPSYSSVCSESQPQERPSLYPADKFAEDASVFNTDANSLLPPPTPPTAIASPRDTVPPRASPSLPTDCEMQKKY